jgi:hypothetical protein
MAFWSKGARIGNRRIVKTLNRESFLFEPAHDFFDYAVNRERGGIDHFRIGRDDQW